MPTRQDIDINFKFKGSRTYVHGTDIYNMVVKFAREEIGLKQIANIKYTLHKVMRTNLKLEFLKNERIPKRSNTSVVFLCNDGSDQYQFLLEENNQPVVGNYEYDEDSIVDVSVFNKDKKTIELFTQLDYTEIELIVALNKGLLNLEFPDGPGKWYLTKIELKEYFYKRDYKSILLKLERNLNFKLTKTKIEIDGIEVGHIYFSSAV